MPLFKNEKKKELRDEAAKEYFAAAKKLLCEKREGRREKKVSRQVPFRGSNFQRNGKDDAHKHRVNKGNS